MVYPEPGSGSLSQKTLTVIEPERNKNLPIHLKLPVAFLADWNISEVTSVVLRIRATKDKLTSGAARGVPFEDNKISITRTVLYIFDLNVLKT